MDTWIRLDTPTGPLIIGAAYRQWGTLTSEAAEIEHFHNRCLDLSARYGRILIIGDFNLDVLRDSNGYSRGKMAASHLEAMANAGLVYCGPYTPTYRSHGSFGNGGHRHTVIDHVYAKGIMPMVTVSSIASTDHHPVIATVEDLDTIGVKPVKQVSCRNYRSLTPAAMESAIGDALADVHAIGDPDEVLDHILAVLTKAMDLVTPRRTVSMKAGRCDLYLSAETRATMKERDMAAACNSVRYRFLRNRAARLVRKDKLRSNLRLIKDASTNPTKLWKAANAILNGSNNHELPDSLTVDGNMISGGKNLAEAMNRFLVDKIAMIRSRAGSNSDESSVDTSTHHAAPAFRFKFPNTSYVERSIDTLSNTPATGVDGIPTAVLKAAKRVIAPAVAHLIRRSFVTSRIPTIFKKAIVRPLYKGKGKNPKEVASYRPVAILPALSKVMEKAVANALADHITDQLPNSQFGFRANRSTTAAISTAHSEWSVARAKGKIVGIASFDLTAAFDTIDAGMLTSKLRKMGVDGPENNWFLDYLSNRSQIVTWNGLESRPIPVPYGVPQGSILGPLLFLVAMADLPAAMGFPDGNLSSGGTVGYADDVVAWATGNSIAEVRLRLEGMANTVTNYTAAHKLALNASKTQVMWAGTNAPSPIVVDGATVIPANSLEILGAEYNTALKSTPFLTSQLSAAKRIRAMIRRLACHFPPGKALANLANALLTGKLGYAAAATFPIRLDPSEPISGPAIKLQVVINDVARTVGGKRITDRIPVANILKSTGLPSLNRLAVRAAAMETWKAVNLESAAGIKTPLGQLLGEPGSSVRATRSAEAALLPAITRVPVETFSEAARTLWNNYPELREAKTKSAAKRVASKLADSVPL